MLLHVPPASPGCAQTAGASRSSGGSYLQHSPPEVNQPAGHSTVGAGFSQAMPSQTTAATTPHPPVVDFQIVVLMGMAYHALRPGDRGVP